MRLPGNIRCSCGTIGRTGGRGYLPSASTALPFLTTDSVSSALMRPRAYVHVARPFRVDIERASTAPPCAAVVNLARAPREIAASHSRPDDLWLQTRGANLRDVHHGNPGGGVEHQRVPLRRKRVVMKVERRTARIAGEPHDAMSCCRVDPVAWLRAPATTAPCPPTT